VRHQGAGDDAGGLRQDDAIDVAQWLSPRLEVAMNLHYPTLRHGWLRLA
jgi:hypothetical protein